MLQSPSFLDHLARIELLLRTLERTDGPDALALAARKVLKHQLHEGLMIYLCSPHDGPPLTGSTHTLLVDESATLAPPWDPDGFDILVSNTVFQLVQTLDRRFVEAVLKQTPMNARVEDLPRVETRFLTSRDTWETLPGEHYLGGGVRHVLGWAHDIPVARAEGIPFGQVLALVERPLLPHLSHEVTAVRTEKGLRFDFHAEVKVTFTKPVYIAGVATAYEPGACSECNGPLMRESSTRVRCVKCRCDVTDETKRLLHVGTTDKPKSFFGKLFGG